MRRHSKGKLDILANVIAKSMAISSGGVRIDGVPLKDYIKKIIMEELQKSGPAELIVHVRFHLGNFCIPRM